MGLEVLLYVVGYYLFAGIAMYFGAVLKTYEYAGIWSFKMTREHIGICKYPYWLLSWLHKSVESVRKWKKK